MPTSSAAASRPTSADLPTDRLAVGQLLGRLLREFREELFAPAADAGFGDIRPAHLRVFGNVGIDGVRLTELAARSQLSLAASSELTSELVALGYLERRADPADRRARLIFPTLLGRRALDAAGNRVAEIEHRWAGLVGRTPLDRSLHTLQTLLDALTDRGERDRPR